MARQMKDSGVDWIGEIPEAWSCSRVGRHYNIILGKMLCSTPCNDSYTYEPYYCAADVHFEGISKARKKMWFSEEEKNTLLVTTGDLLVTEGGTGGCAIVQDATTHTYIQNSLMIVRGRENASEPYLCYWLESLIKQSYLDYICHKVTIIHFTKEKLSGVPLPLPPDAEQQNIISYLDGKISLISKALEQTRATIEEYKKLKQAIITEAVTKGVRGPRPMKPSGVEWIGDIPEEWNRSRVGLHYHVVLGKMLCNTQPNDTYTLEPYYCAADIHFGSVDTAKKKMWFSPEEKDTYRVMPGDLLVVEGGAGAGGCAIVKNGEAATYIQNSIMIVRGKSTCSVAYLGYWIESLVKRAYIDVVCNKATIPHFTKDKLSSVLIPLPSAEEQQEIATYIDAKCAEIDRIIEKKEQLIEELGSYKKSLIYEYVTGKKEVTA